MWIGPLLIRCHLVVDHSEPINNRHGNGISVGVVLVLMYQLNMLYTPCKYTDKRPQLPSLFEIRVNHYATHRSSFHDHRAA